LLGNSSSSSSSTRHAAC